MVNGDPIAIGWSMVNGRGVSEARHDKNAISPLKHQL